ncbi:MAG: radical SAM protein [Chloroflexi bacterium]|nr:radical SAM protein [Chloroflexota bacterium]
MPIIQGQQDIIEPKLQLVAWEITRSCNLFCAHCRASAGYAKYDGEFSTEECYRVINEINEVGKPIIILTGGEPLLRPDALDIAAYAVSKGFRVVLGSNGTLVTEEMTARMKLIPISCVGISLDFPTPELQDKFRGKAGAFDIAMAGVNHSHDAGIDVQINSTITKLNVSYIGDLVSMALNVGAISFYPFLLVPTGRGKDLETVELSPDEYEKTLNWIYDKQVELRGKLNIRPICAPHYFRIARQRQKQGGAEQPPMPRPSPSGSSVHFVTRGCLSGTGFCFISHRGKVQGCGYLDVEAGDLKKSSFREIWNNSVVFQNMRNLGNIKGKCGICEFKRVCGGCRARAYETVGSYLEEEPYCIYQPVKMRGAQ